MNQHPIPQNVTTYQFRLIGDMTIQQFIFLSIGIGFAIFFYYTNLFSLIKWVLVAGSAMGGFAVAFMPFEERPLDQWIVNYIRAIYRPTRFIWHKQPKTPELFTYTTNAAMLPADADEISRVAAARRQQGLQSFLVTLPTETQGNNLDATESSQMESISNMFSATAPASPAQVSVNINVLPPEPLSSAQAPGTRDQGPVPVATTISGVVTTIPIQIEHVETLTPQPSTPVAQTFTQPQSSTLIPASPSGGPSSQPPTPTVAAVTSSDLPFPSTPTTPNTVVGMVLDKDSHIIENAIIEVIDEAGFPVRATRTNQLGQFFSTTPLKRGVYRINIEKVGLNFDTIELTLNGQVVDPLKIVAK